MNNFTRSLLTEWRRLKLPFDDETVVVAVSGGADSVSLLLALSELKERKKLNLRFVAAHLNHALRGEQSDADALFVQDLTGRFNLELALKKEKTSDEGNLEQTARQARYKFLADIAENVEACAVLTAHTLNDQAETLLLNLIRGSGLEGLGGMKKIRNLNGEVEGLKLEVQSPEPLLIESITKEESENRKPKSEILLVRPLLSWAKRQDTENFCRRNEIDFRYDTMNEDLAFKRVRIRKILLPLLEEFNPKAVETLAQTAFLLQDDFRALDEFLGAFKQTGKDGIKAKELKNLFPSIRQMVLREWLRAKRGDLRGLERKHLAAVENLILSRKSGKKAELPNGEFVIKERGRVVFVKSEG